MKQTLKKEPATKATPARSRLLAYAPEVEANRAKYERLAEAWVTVADIETHAVGIAASVDIHGNEVGGTAPVITAFHEHLHDLVYEDFNWFDPRVMRQFYPEMRLAVDQLRWENQQEAKKARRAK